MKNYFKVSLISTLVISGLLIFLKMAAWAYMPWAPAALFLLLAGITLFYGFLDSSFIFVVHSEITGHYRHIPILVTALSCSLLGMFIAALMSDSRGLLWLLLNFLAFVISLLFIFRTIIATIINRTVTPSPWRTFKENNRLFWSALLQVIVTCVILLLINGLIPR
ncbi:MAG: hypothetical protein WC523_06460 [Patescibacteria group bacterium]